MSNITINNSSITATSDMVSINYTTDVTLSKVELTKDNSTWITASTFTQTSASFNISSWSNGTYSNCKLRITYETDTPPANTYTITRNLSNCTCSNNANSITQGSPYSATLSANSGYQLGKVTITMGGNDITNTAYSNGNINISNVTGNIVITANATAVETPSSYSITANLTHCKSSNAAKNISAGLGYVTNITADDGYTVSSIIVTMGGTDVTSSALKSGNQIYIPHVTGNIVITARAN